MSSFQDDSDGNALPAVPPNDTENIEFFTEDAAMEIGHMCAGMIEEQSEAALSGTNNSMLDSDVGQITKSYLDYWLQRIENDEGALEPKTTLGELLLFIATCQAELDLMHQGEKVQ